MVMVMNEDRIEELLKAAGNRPEPDAEVSEAIRMSTHSAWLEVVAEERLKRQRKWLSYSSVAAALFLAVGFFGLRPGFYAPEDSRQLASIRFISGSYQINGEVYAQKAPVMTGDTIQTGQNDLISLVLEDKTMISVAPNTELTFTGLASIDLSKGRVFVDSPDATTSIIINTSWGSIEDIGTQYEVEVDERLTVAMREGKVKMLIDDTPHFASFKAGLGDVLSIDKDLRIDLTQVESTHSRWNWIREAVPHQLVDGMSVYEFMGWAGHVTGKEIVYEDSLAELMASRTLLHGGHVSPMKIDSTLQVLLKTTRLSAVVTERDIRVEQNTKN